MEGSTKRRIVRLKADSAAELDDSVAVEKKLNLSLNGKNIVSLYCTPLMIRELVAGFLLTEGIAKSVCFDRMAISYGAYGDEISVDVPADETVKTGVPTITSGCAGGLSFEKKTAAKAGNISVKKEALIKLFGEFHLRSALYKETGCVHSAAIADAENIIAFAEDIGRHNAVDKAIGSCLLESIGLDDKIMLASGRLSSEMASKCSRWGIPLIASRTAPTDLAIKIAEENGITLVGFLRGERMNVYTFPERIIGPKG